jgi:hypothetical protein
MVRSAVCEHDLGGATNPVEPPEPIRQYGSNSRTFGSPALASASELCNLSSSSDVADDRDDAPERGEVMRLHPLIRERAVEGRALATLPLASIIKHGIFANVREIVR